MLLFFHPIAKFSCLIMRGEHRLRVNEEMVPKKTFLHTMEEAR